MIRLPLLLLIFVLLGACSNALRWTPDYHTVRSGETLYTIALSYNLDTRDLANWNGLGDGTYIRTGQKLRLTPGDSSQQSATRKNAGSGKRVTVSKQPVLPAPAWRWPAAGKVLYRFGYSVKSQSGIRIGGDEGEAVRSTSAGEVVYAGSGLKSYGQLIIVKHNDTWLSAYGFNKALLVKEGTRVSAGQKIATMGKTTDGKVMLHFEIRKNGQPVDPQRYLPKR
ncbi:MAG: peptidoglycan DD-metalloendopeptidase family protein [Gammaproteobacteria bacterium]